MANSLLKAISRWKCLIFKFFSFFFLFSLKNKCSHKVNVMNVTCTQQIKPLNFFPFKWITYNKYNFFIYSLYKLHKFSLKIKQGHHQSALGFFCKFCCNLAFCFKTNNLSRALVLKQNANRDNCRPMVTTIINLDIVLYSLPRNVILVTCQLINDKLTITPFPYIQSSCWVPQNCH